MWRERGRRSRKYDIKWEFWHMEHYFDSKLCLSKVFKETKAHSLHDLEPELEVSVTRAAPSALISVSETLSSFLIVENSSLSFKEVSQSSQVLGSTLTTIKLTNQSSHSVLGLPIFVKAHIDSLVTSVKRNSSSKNLLVSGGQFNKLRMCVESRTCFQSYVSTRVDQVPA